MDQNILFTIILPFYDTLETIGETLDSIVKQQNFDLNTIQVILVNDGDNADLNVIIKKYKEKIKNFDFYKKENGNWGSVVNFVKNKKIALGKYITILDSDDKLTKNTLNEFAKITKTNCDILTSNFYWWKAKKKRKIPIPVYWLFFKKYHLFYKISKKIHLLHTPFHQPLCKFYKKENFYSIPDCIEKISYQDIFIYNENLKIAKSFCHIKKCLGYYRTDRPSSSSNVAWSTNRLFVWKNVLEYLDQNDCTCISIFYFLIKNFVKKYKKYLLENSQCQKIFIHKKFKCCYVWKIANPIVKFISLFWFHKIKQIVEFI